MSHCCTALVTSTDTKSVALELLTTTEFTIKPTVGCEFAVTVASVHGLVTSDA